MPPAEVASPACTAPVNVPGGKPVTAVPGLTPKAPVRPVAPEFVTVEPASTANGAARPRVGEIWFPGVAAVVKAHAWLPAIALPATSLAPVVIVAVYAVLGARALAGVNLAILVDAS
jgi:hypothetical protein